MLVKSLVGGLVAKVTLGMAVAAASVIMAGAAGVLADPGRHATSSAATSTTVAGRDDDEAGQVDRVGRVDRKVNHGACVSAAARDKAESAGGPHGKTVSSIARSDCGRTGASSTFTPTTSTTSTTVAGSPSGNRGNGGNSGNRGSSASRGNGSSAKN